MVTGKNRLVGKEGLEVLELGESVWDMCCCWEGFVYLKCLGGGVEYEIDSGVYSFFVLVRLWSYNCQVKGEDASGRMKD